MFKLHVLPLLAVSATSVSFAQSMERGSFLVRPASSIEGIVVQMERQPGVVRRYASHYGMSKGQVVRYFRTFRPMRLPATTRTVVYGFHSNGINDEVQTLKKGELIYKDSLGRYALRAVCGNPMTSGRQARAALGEENMARIAPKAKPASVPEETMEAEPVATPAVEPEPTPAIVPEPAPYVAPTAEPVTATVVEPAPVVEAAPELAPQTSTIPATSSGGNKNLLPILLGAAAIGGIALAASNNNGGNSAPVPEPTTMLALSAGVAAFAKRRRNKR